MIIGDADALLGFFDIKPILAFIAYPTYSDVCL